MQSVEDAINDLTAAALNWDKHTADAYKELGKQTTALNKAKDKLQDVQKATKAELDAAWNKLEATRKK